MIDYLPCFVIIISVTCLLNLSHRATFVSLITAPGSLDALDLVMLESTVSFFLAHLALFDGKDVTDGWVSATSPSEADDAVLSEVKSIDDDTDEEDDVDELEGDEAVLKGACDCSFKSELVTEEPAGLK